MTTAHLNQVAMSVTNLPGTHAWYREVFGFLPAGGTNSFKGFLAEKVQGITGARSTCWWLVDSQDYFQLELFQFHNPEVRERPQDWRLCDTGYGMVGLHVADFDGVCTRLAAKGTPALTGAIGEPGARRVCVKDPEGVLLELMEEDPLANHSNPVRPDIPVVTRSVTASVPDLARSRAFFADVLGLEPVTDFSLHGPEHEMLWGLEGAERESVLLQADGVLLELVEYREPTGRARPDGYRISDRGLLNIALGYRSHRELMAVYRRCEAAGVHGNWRPLWLGAWSVVYVNDALGFSVELLHVKPWYDDFMGFRPRAVPDKARTPDQRARGNIYRNGIITGGGSGIGRRCAELLIASGSKVAIIDRQITDECSAALERLAAQHVGSAVFCHSADVTDEAGLCAAVDAAVAEIGVPDLALHCAGIQLAKPFADFSGDEFQQVVDVNLVGSRHFATAALAHMKSGSQLALVASLAGLVPSYQYAAYNASKYGVVGLAGALRLEYAARGIDVSVICPPEVETPLVVEERKTMTAVGRKLKSTAGTLQLDPACRSILDGLRRRRDVVIPGYRARLVALAGRWFPGLTNWVSRRTVIAGLRDSA